MNTTDTLPERWLNEGLCSPAMHGEWLANFTYNSPFTIVGSLVSTCVVPPSGETAE